MPKHAEHSSEGDHGQPRHEGVVGSHVCRIRCTVKKDDLNWDGRVRPRLLHLAAIFVSLQGPCPARPRRKLLPRPPTATSSSRVRPILHRQHDVRPGQGCLLGLAVTFRGVGAKLVLSVSVRDRQST